LSIINHIDFKRVQGNKNGYQGYKSKTNSGTMVKKDSASLLFPEMIMKNIVPSFKDLFEVFVSTDILTISSKNFLLHRKLIGRKLTGWKFMVYEKIEQ
jgi:hypothetical protein